MYALATRTVAMGLGAMLIAAVGGPLHGQDPPVTPEPEQEETGDREEAREFEQRMEDMVERMREIRDDAERIDLQMGESLARRYRIQGDVDRPDPPDEPETQSDELRTAEEAAVMLQHERVRRVARTLGRAAENVLQAMEQVHEMHRDRVARRAMEAPDGHQSLEHLWEQLEEVGRTLDDNMAAALRLLEGMGEVLEPEEGGR